MKVFFIFLNISFFFCTTTWAWGGRGHHTLCDAAVFVVQEKELREFLQFRPHVMGYLCNVPDTHWRSLPQEVTALGNPTHFIDLDLLNLPPDKIPLDYAQLIRQWTGQKKPGSDAVFKNFAREFGSVWWRADQFYRLAIQEKVGLADANPETFNQAVYRFYVNLGLLGHFVGDTSQPLHVTKDYDAVEQGHRGLHSYYEDVALAGMPGNLQALVLTEAKHLRDHPPTFLTAKTVLEKMRLLSVASMADISAVIKADRMQGTARLPLAQTLKDFQPLLIKHLARAAALLANLWDQAYRDAGKPILSKYHSYQYPLDPDFVYPDYATSKNDTRKQQKKQH